MLLLALLLLLVLLRLLLLLPCLLRWVLTLFLFLPLWVPGLAGRTRRSRRSDKETKRTRKRRQEEKRRRKTGRSARRGVPLRSSGSAATLCCSQRIKQGKRVVGCLLGGALDSLAGTNFSYQSQVPFLLTDARLQLRPSLYMLLLAKRRRPGLRTGFRLYPLSLRSISPTQVMPLHRVRPSTSSCSVLALLCAHVSVAVCGCCRCARLQ